MWLTADEKSSVVNEKKLAPSVKTRLMSQYSKSGDKWDKEVNKAYVNEFNNTAYHILLPTIGDNTFRKEMERKYGQKQDANAVYTAICAEWLRVVNQ